MKDISDQVKGLSTDHKFNNLRKVFFYVGIGLYFLPILESICHHNSFYFYYNSSKSLSPL